VEFKYGAVRETKGPKVARDHGLHGDEGGERTEMSGPAQVPTESIGVGAVKSRMVLVTGVAEVGVVADHLRSGGDIIMRLPIQPLSSEAYVNNRAIRRNRSVRAQYGASIINI
jgi:hypothetical protein